MPRQPREESPAAPPRKKGGVLDRAKFTDENGAVLFIRLEQKRESLTVRWQRIEGEKSTSGGLAIEAELAAARAAFERAKKDAVANEWQPTAIVWGQAVKMLPLPKANVRARKRVA
jgi:hypothetical protein